MSECSRSMQPNRPVLGKGATRRRVVIRATVVAMVAVIGVPVGLLAHAHLRRSEPAARERLALPPTAIRLWFSERPELAFTRVRLRGADSSEIQLGAVARMTNDAFGLAIPVPATLATGPYTVLWQTAAADGHASRGSFTFEIIAGATPPVAMPDTVAPARDGHALIRVDSTAEEPPRLNATAATRWLEFVAMLAVVGAVVFRLVVLRLAQRARLGALPDDTLVEIVDSVRRLAQSALVLLLIAAVWRFFAEASAVLGPDRSVDRLALRTLLGTSWGLGWLVGVIGVVVAAIGFSMVRRVRTEAGWVVAALGAMAIVIAPALTGHASSTPPIALSLVLDMLHVLAASAWLGALLTLLFAALPFVRGTRAMSAIGSGPLVASLVRAFHPVALTCGAVVIVTGLCATWLRLPAVSSLWDSAYGRVLLLKLAFVAIVVMLGALNWRRILPSLGDDRSAARITRTAGAELTIAALVLAVTAVLVSTPPPESAERGASSVGPIHSPVASP